MKVVELGVAAAVVLACLATPGCSPGPGAVERRTEVAPGGSMPASNFVHPAPPSSAPGPMSAGPMSEPSYGRIQLTAPKAWVQKPPRSSFILAEFALPHAEGDADDGRVSVSTAGGSVQENLDRWKGQFGAKPEKVSEEKIEVAGKQVSLIDLSGTFADQRGPFAPAVDRPGYRMLGAVIDLGGDLYFIKAYGPAKTMTAHADEVREFIKSLKVP